MGVFDSAPTVFTAKASTKVAKAEYHIDGLTELAAIDGMLKTLSAIREQFEVQVKSGGLDIVVAEALRTGQRPANFKILDDGATGAYELRARASTSPLTADEVLIARSLGLPVVENIKVRGGFQFDGETMADPVKMEAISNALESVKELGGKNPIIRVPEVKTEVLGAGAVEASCALKVEERIRLGLSLAAVQAAKAKLDSEEFGVMLQILAKVGIKLVPDAPKAKAKAKAKAKV